MKHIFPILLFFVLFPPEVQAQETLKQVPESQLALEYSYAPLVKKTAPAVVNVYATRQVRRSNAGPLFNDPFFRHFFGTPDLQRSRPAQSLGSGVIVSQDGYIVTNYHVVRDAEEVRVALSDGQEFEATITLKDERTDLAILKVEAGASLPVLTLGNSDDLEVGDIVLAIGNPFGVGQTVTSGIVSGLARTQVGISDYRFFIQTDAAINPGNSGGALVNMRGELVGINTAIFSRSGGSNGIGFAIPANMVRTVVSSAQQGQTSVERPWFGADLQQVSNDIASYMGLNRPRGALVTRVPPETPAANAGVERGDVILALDGTEVLDPESFNYLFGTKTIGGTATLSVLRDGQQMELEIALVKAPEALPGQSYEIQQGLLAGARVEVVTPATAREYRLRVHSGLVVTDVERGSQAARTGLRRGDVLRVVNNVEMVDIPALERALENAGRSWQLVIQRGPTVLRQYFRG